MRVVFQLPRTVQVGHTQEPRSTHAVTQLLVSIPLDALRPQSPAEEPENFSPAAERKHHKHKKHKKNKRHLSDSHREADNRSSDDLPVDVEESSPRPMAPLKFSYKIQPTPPRLPPPPSLVHTPEASGHSRSGKQRHFPPGDSSEAESPVVARGSAERALARSTGKPTTLAGLASLSESDSQRHKKRKHKHHHHPQEDAASFSPMGGDKTVMVSQVVGKEPSTLSKKARLDVPPSQPPMPSFAGEPSVGISRSAIEPKTVSKAPVELSLATPRLPLDPSRTRSSSVTSNSHFSHLGRPHPTAVPLPPLLVLQHHPKAFLKDLHQQIAKRDPEGIFAEPVTDDIAPGYSAIISHPLDLKTILKKIETNQYSSVNEFRPRDLIGVKLIAKEASLRPDISYSVVQPPGGVQDFRLPVPSSSHVDYSSPWLCRISLQAMSGPSQPSPSAIPPPLSISDQNEVVDIGDEGGPKSVPRP
eukprot:Em1351g1a